MRVSKAQGPLGHLAHTELPSNLRISKQHADDFGGRVLGPRQRHTTSFPRTPARTHTSERSALPAGEPQELGNGRSDVTW